MMKLGMWRRWEWHDYWRTSRGNAPVWDLTNLKNNGKKSVRLPKATSYSVEYVITYFYINSKPFTWNLLSLSFAKY